MLGVNKYTGEARGGGFYNDAVCELHEFAAGKGFATGGIHYVPDLAKYAREFTMDAVNDGETMQFYGNDEEGYYDYLVTNSFRAGIAFAHQWHTDFTQVDHGNFLRDLDEAGPMDYTEDLIEKEFGPLEKFRKFEEELFSKWQEIMNGRRDSIQAQDDLFDSLMAVFQTGVSVILEAEGFTSAVREG